VANSRYIAERIARYYGAQSTVVYPPVELSSAPVSTRPLDYFLTVGRLVPGKRIELLVEACNRLGCHLIVAGTGPELTKLRSLAGPTVEIMGRVSDEELTRLYTNARAFLFAADEDFGIATAEAQSYGLPAVAYAHGGSLEIVSEGDEASPADGILFPEQTVDAVVGGIQRFEGMEHLFDRERIQARARRFGMDRFRTGIMEVVTNALNKTLAG
jgi:glycosyltransferase involved in cell wall biosynthesis